MSDQTECDGYNCCPLVPEVRTLKARIALLEAAIRKHREDVWVPHSVNHEDDERLYAALQEQGE